MACLTEGCVRPTVARGLCRPCYHKTPEQIEKIRANRRAWKARNPDKVRADRQKPERKASRKAWRLAHSEEMNRYAAEWQKRNPDAVRVMNQRRRARLRGAPINDFTLEEWLSIVADQEGHCYYCGRDDLLLTQEHRTPLSRGGSHTKDNIVAACQPCNSKKGTKTDVEFADDPDEAIQQVRARRG